MISSRLEKPKRVSLKDFDEKEAQSLYQYICQDFERRNVEFEFTFENGRFTSDYEVQSNLLGRDVLLYNWLEHIHFRDCVFGRSSILDILRIVTTLGKRISSIRFSNCKIVELIDTQLFAQEVGAWFLSAGVNNCARLCITERGLSLDLTLSHLEKSFKIFWDCFYGSLDLIAAIPEWVIRIANENQWLVEIEAQKMCLSHEELMTLSNFAARLAFCTRLELGSWDCQIPGTNQTVFNMIRNSNISALYIGYYSLFPPALPVDALADAISGSTSLLTLGLCFNFGEESAREYVERLSRGIKSPNRLRQITISNRYRGLDRIPTDELNNRLQRMQTVKAYQLITLAFEMTIGRTKQLNSTNGQNLNASRRAARPLLMLSLDIVRKLAEFLPDV